MFLIATLISAATKLVAAVVPHIPTVAKVIKMGAEILPKVVPIVNNIARVTNVLSPDDKLDDLAAKAMSAEKGLTDFDGFGDYMDYLRNEVPEQKLLTDPEHNLARQAVGVALLTKGIGEKLGVDISPEFLSTVAERGLDGKFVYALLQEYKQQGLSNDDLIAYIGSKLDLNKMVRHSTALVNVYQKLEPDLSQDEIENKVMALR